LLSLSSPTIYGAPAGNDAVPGFYIFYTYHVKEPAFHRRMEFGHNNIHLFLVRHFKHVIYRSPNEFSGMSPDELAGFFRAHAPLEEKRHNAFVARSLQVINSVETEVPYRSNAHDFLLFNLFNFDTYYARLIIPFPPGPSESRYDAFQRAHETMLATPNLAGSATSNLLFDLKTLTQFYFLDEHGCSTRRKPCIIYALNYKLPGIGMKIINESLTFFVEVAVPLYDLLATARCHGSSINTCRIDDFEGTDHQGARRFVFSCRGFAFVLFI
jgi:hypothetical protein